MGTYTRTAPILNSLERKKGVNFKLFGGKGAITERGVYF